MFDATDLVNSGALDAAQSLGGLIFLPTLLVLIIAIWLKRPIEALALGAIFGTVLLHGSDSFSAFTEMTLRTATNDDLVWIILVCGFMGSLIALFVRTGAMRAFMMVMIARITTRTSALLTTWLLGIALFVDDYFNCMTLGAAMRDVTDKFKVSREMLAYIIDSTAAPISVIIPISTWGVFFASLLVSNGLAGEGEGFSVYVQAIPFMLYPIIAVLLIPLVIKGIVPAIGPMKTAEQRAVSLGQMIPPDAKHLVGNHDEIYPKPGITSHAALFIVPNVLLVAFTFYFDLDFLKSIYMTLALTVIATLIVRHLSVDETFDAVIDGFKSMLQPIAIIFAAYLLKDINDQLGLTQVILTLTQNIISRETLPAIVFATMGLIAFATGSSWGVFVIALPMIAQLTSGLDANLSLVIGATLSASTLGSHSCLYSDATVLAANSAGCTPLQHAFTQIPYAMIAAAISLVLFLLLGYLT